MRKFELYRPCSGAGAGAGARAGVGAGQTAVSTPRAQPPPLPLGPAGQRRRKPLSPKECRSDSSKSGTGKCWLPGEPAEGPRGRPVAALHYLPGSKVPCPEGQHEPRSTDPGGGALMWGILPLMRECVAELGHFRADSGVRLCVTRVPPGQRAEAGGVQVRAQGGRCAHALPPPAHPDGLVFLMLTGLTGQKRPHILSLHFFD